MVTIPLKSLLKFLIENSCFLKSKSLAGCINVPIKNSFHINAFILEHLMNVGQSLNLSKLLDSPFGQEELVGMLVTMYISRITVVSNW